MSDTIRQLRNLRSLLRDFTGVTTVLLQHTHNRVYSPYKIILGTPISSGCTNQTDRKMGIV